MLNDIFFDARFVDFRLGISGFDIGSFRMMGSKKIENLEIFKIKSNLDLTFFTSMKQTRLGSTWHNFLSFFRIPRMRGRNLDFFERFTFIDSGA